MREERRRLKRSQRKFARNRFGGQGKGKGDFFRRQAESAPPKPLPSGRSARQIVFRILEEHSNSGRFISQLLEKEFTAANLKSGFERRLATELANGIVRRQITLDAILKAFVDRPKDQVEPRLWTILRIGAYQLALASGIKSHAAVSETVELARWCGDERWCGMVNGVLRSILSSVESAAETDSTESLPAGLTLQPGPRAVALDPEPANENSPGELGEQRYRLFDRDVFSGLHDIPRYLAGSFGLPLWLIIRWERRFDQEQLFRLASSFNFRPPLTLRVNSLRSDRDTLLAQLTGSSGEESLPGQPTRQSSFHEGRRPEAIWCRGAGNPVSLPGFTDGHFTIQDETAMSAAALLDPQPGQRVLDLCAAPGTKSTHLAELMQNQGCVVAVDSDGSRLSRVPENAQRLGHSIIETAEVNDDLSNMPEGPFDAALVDVLCSNTGVLGKRPEVRTRLKRGDIAELADKQLKLLTAAAERLAPGGRLVYSTCSIEPEENSGVVSRFLETATEIRLESMHDFFPGEPSDGGFQALLIREK